MHLSPVERLQRQLYNNQQEPDFEDIVVDDEIVTLIYAPNKYISPNEIGLEVVLLVSPTTTVECSTSPSPKKAWSPSPVAEDYASFSMNIPVERLLVSPTTTTELSTSLSTVEEDNAYFSRNAPVEKPLIHQLRLQNPRHLHLQWQKIMQLTQ
ncbi:hypothetical protein CQW23_35348 [Capsicum baccatum]|uniref:Uncharacterized protein n=1 Tax=Capsicum baccatum TaxID=33114 RepID=A0A2G2UW94_CAPBA|nr:hypothetical protein CQW23_35348 [Capsicum baccatum]